MFCFISLTELLSQVDEYLCELPIETLPGIGYVLKEKLKKKNVRTCGQLRLISKVRVNISGVFLFMCRSISEIFLLIHLQCLLLFFLCIHFYFYFFQNLLIFMIYLKQFDPGLSHVYIFVFVFVIFLLNMLMEKRQKQAY